MMTSSNGNIFRVTGPLCGEFTGPGEFPTQRPVTRSFDVFFDLLLNKRLSKQPWGWWFETLYWSLWRHCNAKCTLVISGQFSANNSWKTFLNLPMRATFLGVFVSAIYDHEFKIWHYSEVIISTMAYQITGTSMFAQPYVETKIKENIKASRHWPLWGEFIGYRWNPHTKGQ